MVVRVLKLNREDLNKVYDWIIIICVVIVFFLSSIIVDMLVARYSSPITFLNHTFFKYGNKFCRELSFLSYSCS